MNCVILQNTYCSCVDMSAQVHALLPEARVPYMSEEALEIVDWLRRHQENPDFIIADTEACDGNTLDIFRRSTVETPLILTSSSPDVIAKCEDLNVVGIILKPVDSGALKRVFDGLSDNQTT